MTTTPQTADDVRGAISKHFLHDHHGPITEPGYQVGGPVPGCTVCALLFAKLRKLVEAQ